MTKPAKPSHPRPNNEPFYIDSECPKCGTDLELYDKEGVIWWDEWECPNCKDGIYLDWPEGYKEEIFKESDPDNFVSLEDI